MVARWKLLTGGGLDSEIGEENPAAVGGEGTIDDAWGQKPLTGADCHRFTPPERRTGARNAITVTI